VYFCFQVEVFEEEYEKNNPTSNGTLAFNTSSLNWESFDKFNVQEPFTFDAQIVLLLSCWLPHQPGKLLWCERPFQPIRCNSPPDVSCT
jgi:hypothetical protein